MLTAILERGSWFIFKVGMPLVYFYHLILTSIFFNTAAEDAHGLEKWGNVALAPMQYFFEGKKAISIKNENGETTYQLIRRFDYDKHFFAKMAASCAALPLSIPIGTTLKSLAYLSDETKERASRIYSAMHSTKVLSNLEFYKSIGMQVENYREAEMIAAPKWKRHPNAKNRLEIDAKALKEIVRILSKHEIPFWLDCGSLLGAYQYGGAIPNDWDIDIAMFMVDFENVKNALQELDPKKFVVQDWSGRARPKSYLKVYVHESGGMIDLYNFAIDEKKKQVHTLLSNEFNIFIPKDWTSRELRYTHPMPFSYVFPLKKALYEGIEVPVPGHVEEYLSVFYGENLAPAKVYNESTGKYEKDLTHPYWQLADH
ncbi:MAG: hypothetical protein K1000chlam3_00172 [Chlamydiae bacterium]|nr:hypothetical protein [Chlamydiota bacterium]